MQRCARTLRISALLTSVILACQPLLSATAADWPQFRGPNNDDCSPETGLLQDWPAGGPRLVWTASGLGDGYSSVAVVGERVYSAGDKGDSSFVVALSAKDGKPAWSAKLGKSGAVGDPKFEGPRATPTVSGDFVYAVGQSGELVCLSVAGGKEVWRKDYLQDFGGVRPNWGFSESASADQGRVVITPGGADGSIVALDQRSGAVIWRSKDFTEAPSYACLALAELGGVRQYIQLTDKSVVGVGAADGKLLWRAPRKGNVAVIPSPVYHDGFVYVSSGYGVGSSCFKVSAADGAFTAAPVYANKVMVNHHGGVIRVGDFLYGFSDSKGWTCQDLKTGEAKWQEKGKLGKGTLAYADGRLYLRQEDGPGTIVLVEASPSGYLEHGRFEQPSRSSKNSWAHLVLSGGRLYVRDQDTLLCYDVKAK